MASTDPRPLPEFVDHTDNRRRNDTDPSSPSSPNESKENVNFIKRDAGFVYRQTWKGKIWDTFDLPPFERKMLFKVDAVLLTLLSVSINGEGDTRADGVDGILFEKSRPAQHHCSVPFGYAR